MSLRPRTLQARIILLLSATLLVVTTVIGALTVTTQNGLLIRRLDEQLGASLTRMLGPGGGDLNSPGMPKGKGPGRPRFGSLDVLVLEGNTLLAQVVTESGETEELDQETVSDLLDTVGGRNEMGPLNVNLGELGSYRTLSAEALTEQGTAQVVVGQSLAEVHSTTRDLVLIFALAALLGVGFGSLGVAYLVRRALQPVGELQKVAAQISDLPLSSGAVTFPERASADAGRSGAEVQALAVSFNSMLDHVEGALTEREQTEAKLKQFAADASHELRTPLASISGYAQFASREKDRLPRDVARSLERITSESGRMGTIVEDLLLLARLDSGGDTSQEDTLVAPVLLEALSDAKVAGPDHVWSAQIPEGGAELRAYISAAALRQALGNLLTNARVHTPAGTDILVSLGQADPETVVVRVEDNGPGIDPQLGDSVFDRFVRADAARTGSERGVEAARSTGLGLAITDELARASGGSVTLDSVPGRTVFSIWLPRGGDRS